jgi:hypothetical protein
MNTRDAPRPAPLQAPAANAVMYAKVGRVPNEYSTAVAEREEIARTTARARRRLSTDWELVFVSNVEPVGWKFLVFDIAA